MTNEELKAIRARLDPLESGRHRNEADEEVGKVMRHRDGDFEIGVVSFLVARNALASSHAFRDALLAEVERLRGLIKAVEWVGSCCYDSFCAWCGSPQSYDQRKTGHNDDCPTFTKSGDVR